MQNSKKASHETHIWHLTITVWPAVRSSLTGVCAIHAKQQKSQSWNSHMAFWQPCCAELLSRTLSCFHSHACTGGSQATRREAWWDCLWDWRTDAPHPLRMGQRRQRSQGCLPWHDMWWPHSCYKAEDQPLATHNGQFSEKVPPAVQNK